jgi:hypothetical protein
VGPAGAGVVEGAARAVGLAELSRRAAAAQVTRTAVDELPAVVGRLSALHRPAGGGDVLGLAYDDVGARVARTAVDRVAAVVECLAAPRGAPAGLGLALAEVPRTADVAERALGVAQA